MASATSLIEAPALINREGKLVGVGSLIVGDAGGKGEGTPGNMFVPIDRLGPILADLIAEGSKYIRQVDPMLTLVGLKLIYEKNRHG